MAGEDEDETGELAADYERLLGGVLMDREHIEPAALLLDCRLVRMAYIDTGFPIGGGDGRGIDLRV